MKEGFTVQFGENLTKLKKLQPNKMFLQGVPKKIVILSGFEFLTLGGVFLGVKNNSKNFLFYKIFWFV